MAEQDRQGIVGEVEGDQARRDPRRDDQRGPALDFENDEKELALMARSLAIVAVQDERARDGIVGEIDEDEEDEGGKQREREQPDGDLGRPDLGEAIAREHEDARPERRHSAGVGAVIVLID